MLYASSDPACGNYTFHRIQEVSLCLFEGHRSAVSVRAREFRVRSAAIRAPGLDERETLIRKQRSKYGLAKNIGRPGARGSEVMLREFQVRVNEFFSMSKVGGCFAAALLNTVRALKGADVEIEVAKCMGDGTSLTLPSAGVAVQRSVGKVEL